MQEVLTNPFCIAKMRQLHHSMTRHIRKGGIIVFSSGRILIKQKFRPRVGNELRMDFKAPFVALDLWVFPRVCNSRWGLPSCMRLSRPRRDNVDILYIAFVCGDVADTCIL